MTPRTVLLTLALLLAACSDDGQGNPPLDHGVRAEQPAADLSVNSDVQPLDAARPKADASAPADGAAPTGCNGAGLAPGSHTIKLQHGGLQRSYLLLVPKTYNNAKPTPLVLNLHGVNTTAGMQVLFSNMNPTAEKYGFVLAYPQGIQNSWNAGVCCGIASAQNIDDVGFIRAVVADLQQKLCIDSRRIYAAGISNGGQMTYRLACEAADLFAAVGTVAASNTLLKPCTPPRPVPLVSLHGDKDGIVSYASGVAAVNGWIQRNGCTDTQPTQTYSKGVATCVAHTQCKGGTMVEFCTIIGGGHCWFGNPICPLGASTTDVSSNERMWELFKKYPMP